MAISNQPASQPSQQPSQVARLRPGSKQKWLRMPSTPEHPSLTPSRGSIAPMCPPAIQVSEFQRAHRSTSMSRKELESGEVSAKISKHTLEPIVT
jgi:hypothetical protein